jgi:hypothetical protein
MRVETVMLLVMCGLAMCALYVLLFTNEFPTVQVVPPVCQPLAELVASNGMTNALDRLLMKYGVFSQNAMSVRSLDAHLALCLAQEARMKQFEGFIQGNFEATVFTLVAIVIFVAAVQCIQLKY